MGERQVVTVDRRPSGTGVWLACSELTDHPLRMDFYSQRHLERLAASIEEQGLFEPILVWPLTDGRYRILSGHYRIRAVRRLRWERVPCCLFSGDRDAALRVYCGSNLMVREANPIEEAFMISGLIKTEGLTMKEVGELLGHCKSWVSRRVRLLTGLDPEIREMVAAGDLKPRMAQEIARLPRGNEQRGALKVIRAEKMSKNEAATFITRWMATDGDVRGGGKEETGGPLLTKEHPADRAARMLRRGLGTVEDLICFVKAETGPFHWWPRSDFHALQVALETLDRLTRE